jgi:hypothetical protein
MRAEEVREKARRLVVLRGAFKKDALLNYSYSCSPAHQPHFF